MSEYIDCQHDVTVSSQARRGFGDVLPQEVFHCLSCQGWFMKNYLLDGAPVEPLYSELARAWRAGYPTVEMHTKSMKAVSP